MSSTVYIARATATWSTQITILQVTAASTKPIRLLRAWVNQASSTTSAQTGIQILRKSATATGLTSVTPAPLDTSDSASSATAGHTATGEGTDSTVLLSEGFNILNGWLYLPVPEERIEVPASGIIALKFTAAPSSATYHVGIAFEEIG